MNRSGMDRFAARKKMSDIAFGADIAHSLIVKMDLKDCQNPDYFRYFERLDGVFTCIVMGLEVQNPSRS